MSQRVAMPVEPMPRSLVGFVEQNLTANFFIEVAGAPLHLITAYEESAS